MIRNLSSLPGFFQDFERMFGDVDQLFEPWGRPASIRSLARGTFPVINVGSDEHHLHVYAMLPGVDAAQLEISLHDGVLTIGGQRDTKLPAQGAYLQERFSGKFSRSITLPEGIDGEKVEANYRNGVLHIRIARREESKPRRIEVA